MDGIANSTLDVRKRAMRAIYDEGMPVTAVACAYGTNRSTIHRWMKRFESGGETGLLRKAVTGRPRKLSQIDSAKLRRIVLSSAMEFGYETDFWTIRRLIQVIEDELHVSLSKQTIMRRLHEAGLTYQKPEREYFELSEDERSEWVRKEIPRIRRAVRKYDAIMYFQDEANVSLTALLAKTWSPRGETPKQRVTGKRAGVAAMSAITKRGNLIFKLHEKRIASPEIIAFLSQMLRHHSKRHLVVIMDQAPPHTSKMTKAFIASQPRLHVFHLPKYSPDWNPDEKVWNHLKNQELKGHQAKTKSELVELTQEKLNSMACNHSLLRGIYFRCCIADMLNF